MADDPSIPNGDADRALNEVPSPEDTTVPIKPDPSNVFLGAPAAVQAALTGEPNTLPLTWCRLCKAEVKPMGKGKCPRCGTFLRQNFVARRHPVNKLRVDQHLAELIAEFRPTTVVGRRTCEQLAGIYEQLEGLKPGSTEWQRLVTTAQTLVAALEASRSVRESTTATNLTDLSPDELVAHAERVLEMACLLKRAQEFDGYRHPDGVDGSPVPDGARPDLKPEDIASTPGLEVSAPSTPEPVCAYCHQSPARCTEIKATRLDSWRALHYLDPEEVERREKAATDEMFESLKRYGPQSY